MDPFPGQAQPGVFRVYGHRTTTKKVNGKTNKEKLEGECEQFSVSISSVRYTNYCLS